MRTPGTVFVMLLLALLHIGPTPVAAQSSRQARLCRSLLPVFNPATAAIRVSSTQTIGGGDGVIVNYDVSELGGRRQRGRRVVCAFARHRDGPDELLLVSSDGRVLGLPRLLFLKRYYLRSRDAAAADEILQLPVELQHQKPRR